MKSAYWLALIAFVVAGLGLEFIALGLIFPPAGGSSNLTPTVEFAVAGGEAGNKFAFALQGQQLTSPGPTIKVKNGDIVRINFKNGGATAHAFSVTKENKDSSPVVFKATVGTGARPLTPGNSGGATFKVDQKGDYFYLCPVPGHALLGMWGEFKVEG